MELAVATHISPLELMKLDGDQLATLIDVITERSRR